MTRFSDEFKYSIIKRMMPPNNESVSAIARETGLSEATHTTQMEEEGQSQANGIAVPGGELEAERWSTQDKFLIVVETASLSEIELAEYCRTKGLFVEQVEAWRDACMHRPTVVLPNRLFNYKRVFAKRIVNSKTSKRNSSEKKLHLLKLPHF